MCTCREWREESQVTDWIWGGVGIEVGGVIKDGDVNHLNAGIKSYMCSNRHKNCSS